MTTAPHNRTETSREAATAIEPHLGPLQAKLMQHLDSAGASGATDQEMQAALKMDPSTQRPRRIELARRGLIVQSGHRKTKANRRAVVWLSAEWIARHSTGA